MKVRIFVPDTVYHQKSIGNSECDYIFGKIVADFPPKYTSIFIVGTHKKHKHEFSPTDPIGQISNSKEHFPKDVGNYICFKRNNETSTLQIYEIKLSDSNESKKSYDIQIFLYDLEVITELARRDDEKFKRKLKFETDSISMLLTLVRDNERQLKYPSEHININGQSYGMELILILTTLSVFLQSKFSFVDSAFLKHFVFWSSNLKANIHRNGYLLTVFFDVVAGIVITLCLWHISNADDYLIKFTMVVVKQLQKLLDALNGSPVGLKLNVELNDFFLACFRYHVELWATFLIIVAPLIKYLFAPLTIIGCLGLSFQLSMLIDLLNIITLHCHCIYVYASILYRIEIDGLVGFWRIVSGRRKNIMKDRIESYEYTNPQLYLSTLFFAALLFLLPTFLVYYIVFASLRFAFYCIVYVLTVIGQKLLALPLVSVLKWCTGKLVSCDNFQINYLKSEMCHLTSSSNNISLFSIQTVRNTFPTWIDSIVMPTNVVNGSSSK